MKLIVNADDFGLSEAVNYGIIKAYKDGIVRSTTLMVNMSAAAHALELHRQYPALGIGIHLVLTAGRPEAAGHKTLTGSGGIFWTQTDFFAKLQAGLIDTAEVEAEWRTQIEKARSLGFALDHIDSHHHVHMCPELAEVSFRVASDYNLPIRAGKNFAAQLTGRVGLPRTTDSFSMEFYGEKRKLSSLLAILDEYKKLKGTIEIMCHPAYIDNTLVFSSGYVMGRLDELDALTCSQIKEYIEYNKIEPVNFSVVG